VRPISAPSQLSTTRRSALDYLDLVLLRLAKRRRARFGRSDNFYEAFFTESDYEKYVRDVRQVWRYRLFRRVLESCHPHGPINVVDVGCGLGISSLYIPERASLVGVDVSERSLERARALGRERAEFRQGGFPDLPLESASFDFALCLEVLEHVADDRRAVAEIFRVLRPGGYLLVSVPSTYYWREYKSLIGHFRHYNTESLRQLLKSGGFEVVQSLPQFGRLFRSYHYIYIAMLGAETLLRRVGWREFSLYQSSLYRWLSSRILRRLDARGDEFDAISTFMLCQRLP
jgi:ubiquinone/menaquinone biosynthesis C-methylase UbiE